MHEFLHSWNRQAGLVTLVMALGVTGQWVRSLCCYDHVDFAIGDRQHMIYSMNGAASWWSWDLTGDRATRRINGWGTMLIPEGGGFSGTTLTPPQYRPASTSLQYWTIAIPLTIVSAVLLLLQPRRLSSSIAIRHRSRPDPEKFLYDYGSICAPLVGVPNGSALADSSPVSTLAFGLIW